MQPRYYRIGQIASTSTRQGLIAVNPSTVWRWAREGKFPKPMKLADKVTVWDAQEIDAWLANKRGEQPATAPTTTTPPSQTPATKGLKVAA